MQFSSLVYVDRFSPTEPPRSARSATPVSPRDLLQQRIEDSPFLDPFLGFGIATQAEREHQAEQMRIADSRWSTSAADTNISAARDPVEVAEEVDPDARWRCPLCKTTNKKNVGSNPNGSKTCKCGCVLEEQEPVSLARQKNCPEEEDGTRTADDPDSRPKSRFLHALGIESADDARKRRLRETDATRVGKQKSWPCAMSTSTSLVRLESLDAKVEHSKDARRAAARVHAQAANDANAAPSLDETRLRALCRSLDTILRTHFPSIHPALTKLVMESAQIVLENTDAGLIAKSRVANLAIAILQHVLGHACVDVDNGRLGEVPRMHARSQLTIALQLRSKNKTFSQSATLKSAVAAALGHPTLPLSPLSSFKPRPLNSPSSSPTLTASSSTSSMIGSPPLLSAGLKAQNASTSSLDGAFVSLSTHCASSDVSYDGAVRSLSAPPPSGLHFHGNDSDESEDEEQGEFPAADDDDENDAQLF
jgi:hypothetical protein